MKSPLNVLTVEFTNQDNHQFLEYLRKSHFHIYTLNHAPSINSAITLISNQTIDIVLLNVGLTNEKRFDNLELLHKKFPGLCILTLDTKKSNQDLKKSLQYGAIDYLYLESIDDEILDKSIAFAVAKKTQELKYTLTEKILNDSNVVAFQWLHAEDGPVSFASENCVKIFGYTSTEFTKGIISYQKLMHPEDLARIINEAFTAISDPEIDHFKHKPYRILTKSGQYIWVKDSTKIIRNENGIPTHYEGLITDITAQVEAEHQNEILLQAINQSASSVAITDIDGNINYVNSHFLKNSGYTKEELIGQNNRILKSGIQDQSIYKDLWETIVSGKTWYGKLANKNKVGKVYWERVKIDPIKDNSGENVGYIAVKEDITVERLYQEQIQNAVARLNLTVQTFELGIWVYHVEENRLDVNDELLSLYGIEKKDFDGTLVSLRQQIIDEDKASSAKRLERMLDGESIDKTEVKIKRKDGEVRSLLAAGTPIKNNEGKVVEIFAINLDITNTKEKELKLQELSQIAELDNNRMLFALENNHLLIWEIHACTDEIKSISKIDSKKILKTKNQIKRIDDFISIIHKDQQKKFTEKYGMLLDKNMADEIEIELLTKNFSENYEWKYVKGKVISTNENKEPELIYLLIEDIQQQKESERIELEAQEKERLRVSRDIHDSIGQMLVGTRLLVNQNLNFSNKSIEKIQTQIKEVDQLLDQIIKETRLIINNLGVSVLNEGGLKISFENLIKRMERVFNGEVILKWEGEPNYKNDVDAAHIFRIFQESLSNAIKYAEATTIEIKVSNLHIFALFVIDNGNGFEVTEKSKGFGLKNMLERARIIKNAKVNVKSSVGKGTEVSLMIDK